MVRNKLTDIGVYIIETLNISDENDCTSEGSMIQQMLDYSGVQCVYRYVRTSHELKYFLEDFAQSGLRYLHISCHGSNQNIATTLDEIPFSELMSLLPPRCLDNRRLFLSACSSTNKNLAELILNQTKCYSIIGDGEEIRMDAAAIFWSSFYFAMLADDQTKMRRRDIKFVLRTCSRLCNIPVNYFARRGDGSINVIEIKNGCETQCG